MDRGELETFAELLREFDRLKEAVSRQKDVEKMSIRRLVKIESRLEQIDQRLDRLEGRQENKM